MPIHLLLIEDESAIRDLIRHSLPASEFTLIETGAVKQAEVALRATIPDLILVDWMLPGKSGVDFIQWLRAHPLYHSIPVMLLTAKAEEHHKVTGLTQGADDYLTKPFSPAELMARIKTILRRGKHQPARLNAPLNEVTLDEAGQRIRVGEHWLSLRPMEYKLFHFLLTHPNKVFTREQLLNYVWGVNAYVDERTVDATIKRLRATLTPFSKADMIQTIRGSGYLLRVSHD